MKRLILATATVVFLASALTALAHTDVWNGGGGNDTKHGHEHRDEYNGGAGCDDLYGHADADYLVGGDNGCDKVRGMESKPDGVVTWDDNYGNDEAYGGDGSDPNGDQCFVGNQDYVDVSSCEHIYLP
jgi:Ca2+-binding RTX toxin-like protein